MDFLALFDIDNTLLKNLTAHKKSFFEGLRKIYSIQADVESINPHGMTDQQIITEVLKKHEIKEKRNALNFKECMNTIVETFAKEIKNENPVILNGVTHLLEELFRRKIIMGIVSGNLEPIAKLKLEFLILFSGKMDEKVLFFNLIFVNLRHLSTIISTILYTLILILLSEDKYEKSSVNCYLYSCSFWSIASCISR